MLCVWRLSGSGTTYALKSSDGLKKLLISSSPPIKLSGSGTTTRRFLLTNDSMDWMNETMIESAFILGLVFTSAIAFVIGVKIADETICSVKRYLLKRERRND